MPKVANVSGNGKAKKEIILPIPPQKNPDSLDLLCVQLQSLQKERAWIMKTVIMFGNRLRAMVASHCGYTVGLTETEREKMFKEAQAFIDSVDDMPEEQITTSYLKMIRRTRMGIQGLEEIKGQIEKSMLATAKQLPVASWVAQDDQRGFGLPFLAVVIGEAGNLSNYPGFRQVWKRFGLAPFKSERHNKELMGSTWKRGKEGSLNAEEWEKFGYCPRRRSIAYLIGKNLSMLNFKVEKGTKEVIWSGPYRKCMEEKKASYVESHPETPKGRANSHGMAMATKLLLKNLWQEWKKVM